MNIEDKRAYMIFRNDYENRAYYKVGISKKKIDGSFESGYIPIQFKRDVDIPNKTKIYLRQAWLTFYTKKTIINGVEHSTSVPYVFCNEFITVQDRIEETRPDFDAMEEKKNIKVKELELTDDDLPF